MRNVIPDADRTGPPDGKHPADEAPAEELPERHRHDVRAGGDATHAPRSLSEAEAHWQEHESSGSSWDEQESI